MSGAEVSQALAQVVAASRTGDNVVDAPQALMQVVASSYPSIYVDLPQVFIQEVDRRPAHTEVAQAFVQCVVQENTAYIFRSRAWGFTWDGHPLYALTLGTEGTWIYDQSTDQWSQFMTAGSVTWQMENGVTWNDEIYAGELEQPNVWRFDYVTGMDQGSLPITGVVTGGIPIRGRASVPCHFVHMYGAPGLPIAPGTITLRISDDQGRTWFTVDPVIDIASADWTQPVTWRSLGNMRAPGRVFEIVDVGGTVRIDDAQIEGPEGE